MSKYNKKKVPFCNAAGKVQGQQTAATRSMTLLFNFWHVDKVEILISGQVKYKKDKEMAVNKNYSIYSSSTDSFDINHGSPIR